MEASWERGELDCGAPFWWRAAHEDDVEPEVRLDEPAQMRSEARARAQSEQGAQRPGTDIEQERKQGSAYATRAELLERDARLVSDMKLLEERLRRELLETSAENLQLGSRLRALEEEVARLAQSRPQAAVSGP